MMVAPPRSNPFFRLVVVAGGLFVVTVLGMVATTFGDPEAPPNLFFRRFGFSVIIAETVIVVVVSILALVVDRIQTLAALKRDERVGELKPSTADVVTPSLSTDEPCSSEQ